ncbi:hypothetical protein KIN20_032968 [Parelaphostrongylus tenuis]|uniref:Uncharacterized protein n=1 Tax=Parelaphostrongylus tenuis TaxID=148309 RepID=A0AAD5WIV7_PARTN|nr:hypothetical protein KIN20_032968 [Parelaphostrongylus tenuis]
MSAPRMTNRKHRQRYRMICFSMSFVRNRNSHVDRALQSVDRRYQSTVTASLYHKGAPCSQLNMMFLPLE